MRSYDTNKSYNCAHLCCSVSVMYYVTGGTQWLLLALVLQRPQTCTTPVNQDSTYSNIAKTKYMRCDTCLLKISTDGCLQPSGEIWLSEF